MELGAGFRLSLGNQMDGLYQINLSATPLPVVASLLGTAS